ncbi:(Na+)-NQR maturation NqrM [Cocleimonas sp. KMM 6892]|uniref:(Na+)-NQR maturation NqrM n=1 Tax=unclassified Cocleimonas TaxID=2639732 RepID=UPI002DC0100B|nr:MULTISPECIES: (Na+)-NQR maturation NqrM [unclassified Cocleimonas]MEB8430795.1 (Na+)-NQR maturation NqrM [Cocleimonas sp. KMM 6892]MEC4714433.1 (Na+)-NQR maturation NqrM [Cocleimonas sp. KMM 6895]MEC4743764.1 (Na+)-NQR maturation NqrM [Cocleimonas sp. KMM 6896]
MQIFLFTFMVLLLAFLGMAAGVLLNNRELKGSCGGLSNIPGVKGDCSCSNPCEKRKARMAQEEKDSAENSDTNSNEQQNITKDYAQINIDQLRTGIK